MTGFRFSMRTCLVVVFLVCADLAALRHATDQWGMGRTFDQPLLNLLPMGNALVLAGVWLVRSRGERWGFGMGFFVCGLAALVIQGVVDRVNPGPMWGVCDWLANGSVWRYVPYTDLRIPGRGTVFRYYPLFAFVIAAPQFLVAIAGGWWMERMKNGSGEGFAQRTR